MHCPFSLKQCDTISFGQYSLIDQLLMRNRWMKTRYLDIHEHILLNREAMCVDIKKIESIIFIISLLEVFYLFVHVYLFSIHPNIQRYNVLSLNYYSQPNFFKFDY